MSKDKIAISSVTDVAEFDNIFRDEAKSLLIVHFFASWAPQCQQIDDVLTELYKDPKLAEAAKIIKIEAEALPEISTRFNITAVPTCVLLKGGAEVDRVNGVKAAELTSKVMQHALGIAPHSDGESSDAVLNERLKKLINSANVMVFMKGTPENPQCGFSRTLMELLNKCNAKFSTFDILTDEAVRQGLKEYSNWPTYPQVYVKGELIGGLDLVKELISSGEFQAMLPATPAFAKNPALEDRLKALIVQQPIMLFMKGSPDVPKCKFSKAILALLNEKKVKFGHFDILEDEEVRQGLKTFSNWPTFPQLYIKGELVGGLDIVTELSHSGELDALLKGVTA